MQFRINGETYDMVTRPTFGEARAVEKVTGVPFAKISGDAAEQTIDVTQAFLWISMKRKEPTLTFSGLDDLSIEDVEWLPEEGDETPDPTAADAAAAPTE